MKAARNEGGQLDLLTSQFTRLDDFTQTRGIRAKLHRFKITADGSKRVDYALSPLRDVDIHLGQFIERWYSVE